MIIALNSNQTAWRDALYSGLDALGVEDLGGDVAVCWGWRRGMKYKRQKMRVLVFERGYLDRFSYTSIGWNGLNGRAAFPVYPDDGGERFRQCGFELKPVRTGGEYALVIGQVATDMAVRDINIREWVKRTVRRVHKETGLPVVYRPHPQDVKRRRVVPVRGVPLDTGDLQAALGRAALVVTYSSNTAVDAMIAGVPVVAMSEGSMAYGVAATDIDGQVDWEARENWAHRLAWKQWAMDEIASGEALRGIVNAE